MPGPVLCYGDRLSDPGAYALRRIQTPAPSAASSIQAVAGSGISAPAFLSTTEEATRSPALDVEAEQISLVHLANLRLWNVRNGKGSFGGRAVRP